MTGIRIIKNKPAPFGKVRSKKETHVTSMFGDFDDVTELSSHGGIGVKISRLNSRGFCKIEIVSNRPLELLRAR